MAFISSAMKNLKSREVIVDNTATGGTSVVYITYGWTDRKSGVENTAEGYILLDKNGDAVGTQVINLASARFYLNLDKDIQDVLKVDINTRSPQKAKAQTASTRSLLA